MYKFYVKALYVGASLSHTQQDCSGGGQVNNYTSSSMGGTSSWDPESKRGQFM